ncbi:carboxypeptidase N subunit 2-like [Fopius arisanus]|uniref:Carboxypeptidase N subunit 2-like n=1 Tax=Fopius arisanus TaxID=64838 RepID=A0A9R1TWX4_9HYME|nr:PREDICTED: carboxypeptidase N subunit 2-like [Fopius arisanus]
MKVKRVKKYTTFLTPGIITVTADSFSDVQDVRSLHIECVQFRGFPTPFINQEYLERIDFLDNHFTEFPREFCANISSIKSIRVNYQQITKLSATSFSSIASYLQNLELGHIQLKIIEPNTFSRFRYLKNLRLNGNQLEILRPDMFDNLSFLETLDLGENVIRTIKPETFSALTRLRALFLQSNHLRNLPQKIFSDLLNLEMLYLHGNRFIKDPIDLVTGLLQLTDYSGVVNKTLNVYQ